MPQGEQKRRHRRDMIRKGMGLENLPDSPYSKLDAARGKLHAFRDGGGGGGSMAPDPNTRMGAARADTLRRDVGPGTVRGGGPGRSRSSGDSGNGGNSVSGASGPRPLTTFEPRNWGEFLTLHAKLPRSPKDAKLRAELNLAFYETNYLIVAALCFAVAATVRPAMAQTVILTSLALGVFFWVSRGSPFVDVLGYQLGQKDRERILLVVVLGICVLCHTRRLVLYTLGVASAICLAHALFKRPHISLLFSTQSATRVAPGASRAASDIAGVGETGCEQPLEDRSAIEEASTPDTRPKDESRRPSRRLRSRHARKAKLYSAPGVPVKKSVPKQWQQQPQPAPGQK